MKTDYRKGLPPSNRKRRVHYTIRQLLEGKKKTFSELLRETGISRSTLSFHLKDMQAKGELDRETDPKDYRITIYRLKPKWTPEIQKEADIENISSMRVAWSNAGHWLKEFLRPSLQRLSFSSEQFRKFVEDHVSYSTYAKGSKKEIEDRNVKKLLETATLSAISELFSQPEHLGKLSDFSIVIRFKKAKELAKKLEEAQKKTEGQNILEIPKKPWERD